MDLRFDPTRYWNSIYECDTDGCTNFSTEKSDMNIRFKKQTFIDVFLPFGHNIEITTYKRQFMLCDDCLDEKMNEQREAMAEDIVQDMFGDDAEVTSLGGPAFGVVPSEMPDFLTDDEDDSDGGTNIDIE